MSRALRSVAPEALVVCSSSDEDVMSLARRESRADSPAVSLQLLDLSERKLAAYGGFFREENITVLAARSILYAVRFAESRYPPWRLLNLFSQSCVGTERSAMDAQNPITFLSVMRRIFASGFRASFVLSFKWIPSLPMGPVSSFPSAWCGLIPGLIGSQLLGVSQFRWSSAGFSSPPRTMSQKDPRNQRRNRANLMTSLEGKSMKNR